MDNPLIQSIGTLAVAVIPFIVAWLDQKRRHAPNRIEDKASTPVKLTPAAELPMGVVLKTSAINAELLQQVFAQNKVISAQLNQQGEQIKALEETDKSKSEKIDSMEKQIDKLKADNSRKSRKITKLERRVRQLEEEMRRQNIEIPPDVPDTGELVEEGDSDD